jgi:ribosomal protein S12 methylthiotransferase
VTRLYLHNLGCSKNQIEGELLAGWGAKRGVKLTRRPEMADVIVINTCAFIQEAQEEAIEAILDAARFKTEGQCLRLYVCGCFPQRFGDELPSELPEVDGFFGVGQWKEILELISPDGKPADFGNPFLQRRLTTPKHYAYLRIADGCNRGCSYCLIPAIRGEYRSRPPEEIVEEAEDLVRKGARELLPVAQELNSYGHDLGLGRGNKPLIALLEKLCAVKNVVWVRPLYLHPPACDEELFAFWASQAKLCRYLDLPIEHASGRVLKAMARGGSRRQLENLVAAARRHMPDVILRTSIIVGFPGETEADFAELLDFVRLIRFQRLGSFDFSCQEGTPAANLPDQVPPNVRSERRDRLMEVQMEISAQCNLERVGSVEEVFVDEYEKASGYSLTHSRQELPELDGDILIPEKYAIGSRLKVRIVSALEYDLMAEVVEEK